MLISDTPRTAGRAPAEATFATKMAAELPYSPEVLALWNEKDEEASEKWRQEKIKDFEAGGPTKEKHKSRVKTQARSGQPGCQRGGSHGGSAEAG